MKLPFTVDQFFEVFRQYNTGVWPAQVLLVALAVAAVLLVVWRRPWSDQVISAILALLWIWVGLAYHWAFFSRVNPAAYGFAALSLLGAAVLAWQGVYRRRLCFAFSSEARTAGGGLAIVYALIVYPIWSHWDGHAYPAMPTFGLPCPTTIFTIGMLALARGPAVRAALIVPVLWSAVGAQAVFLFKVRPDLGLLVAGLLGLALWLRPRRSFAQHAAAR